MPIPADELLRLVKDAFPNAEIRLEDLAGDGDHYRLHIAEEAFRGKTKVVQHRMVYDALQGKMGGELHALALNTTIPN